MFLLNTLSSLWWFSPTPTMPRRAAVRGIRRRTEKSKTMREVCVMTKGSDAAEAAAFDGSDGALGLKEISFARVLAARVTGDRRCTHGEQDVESREQERPERRKVRS